MERPQHTAELPTSLTTPTRMPANAGNLSQRAIDDMDGQARANFFGPIGTPPRAVTAALPNMGMPQHASELPTSLIDPARQPTTAGYLSQRARDDMDGQARAYPFSPIGTPRPATTPTAPAPDNYQGDMRNRTSGIPEHLNCSLFLTNLPSDCDTATLLGAIRRVGKVYQTHINAPEPAKGIATSAAKLTFFTHQAAQKLLDRARTAGVWVGGRRAFVVRNRHAVADQEEPGHASRSRVLVVYVQNSVANPAGALMAYFGWKGIRYQLERVIDHTREGAPCACVEFWFGSYLMQAERAAQCLRQEDRKVVDFVFGNDPSCD